MRIMPFYTGIKSCKNYKPVKFLRSIYYASRPLEMATMHAPKLPLSQRITKFFKALINANRY